ncbi:uncharacterized protein LOC129568127 [Sitodiplosis mosellana]|uniref:uncharacterized protein LOC129568127 n=1 Tax=Sitodiplosis mosellana TaxID=263140 RepID=UPI0024447A5A|nr:uncharacterized protein LOC129568127 [Sitodiplosis mosellana]
MDIHIIFTVLLMSTVNQVVFTLQNQYIGECYYDDGNYAESNLTLVCVKEYRETALFKPSWVKPICLNQGKCRTTECKDGFYKFMIGRVSFKNCVLPKIPDKLFKIYDNIRILNMANISTVSLHPDDFAEAHYLTNLNASFNKISEISSNLFANAQKLIDVDFSFNRIVRFHAHAFANGNHLTHLNLSHNNIVELNVEMFQKLTQLKHLRLDHNKIVELPSFLFHKNEKLTEVDFSYNKIKKIDNFAFAGDFKLEYLNLSHNELTTFQKRFSDNHSKLKKLDLSSNRIHALKPDTFDSLRDLVLLDISSNFLEKLDNKTFSNLLKLQTLILSRNNLTEVRLGTFSPLLSLRVLDLSKNMLKTLDADILPPQSSYLELIVIADNQLRELRGFTSLRIPNTKIIGIDSNRFNCTFLDQLFDAITWKHLDAISIRIECNSANETREITTNGTIGSGSVSDFIENATFSWIDESISSTDTVTINPIESATIAKTLKNSEFYEGNVIATNKSAQLEAKARNMKQKSAISTKHGHNVTQHTHSHVNSECELTLVKKYLYLLICIVTVGFTIAALLFTRLIHHTRMLEKERDEHRTDFDVKYYVETVKPAELPQSMNSIENHTYEVIEIVKNGCSSQIEDHSDRKMSLSDEITDSSTFVRASNQRVEEISFENCEFVQLPYNIFSAYPDVHLFNISNVGIQSLQPESFDFATDLIALNASHNRITEVPAFLLRYSPNLTDVDFSYNQIEWVDPDAFTLHPSGSHIKHLNLSRNNFTELPVSMFKNLVALESLQMTHNQIEKIPSFLFRTCNRLIDIDFSYNKIATIGHFGFFEDFYLQVLNLSHNNLKKLDIKIGGNLYLTHLDVSSNQITKVETNALKYLQKLVFLNLSQNPIRKLNSGTFAGLANLEYLNLSQTELTEIQPGTFSSFKALRILWLSKNHIKILDGNIFSPSHSLGMLFIDENPIEELNDFTELFVTTSIHIGTNLKKPISMQIKMKFVCCVLLLVLSILTVNCNVFGIPAFEPFNGFNLTFKCEGDCEESVSNLISRSFTEPPPGFAYGEQNQYVHTISFHNCKVDEIPRGIFSAYPNIQSFDVSKVGIKSLGSHSFDVAGQLEIFNASHNQLTEVPAELFLYCMHLTNVDFSNNQIERIDPDAFVSHPVHGGSQIKHLNLSRNNISEVNAQIFNKLIALVTLDLSHNQIEQIPSFLLHKADNLIEADFSFNKIYTISDFALFGDFNLQKLNLESNRLTKIDKPISEQVYLTHLDLSSNQIARVESNDLKYLCKLVYLDLSGNPLRKINNKTFADLVYLNYLNLSRTELTEIEPGTFGSIKDFETSDITLDLTKNFIKSIDANIMSALFFGQILLQDNPIEEINGFNKITLFLSIHTDKVWSCARMNEDDSKRGCLFSMLVPMKCRLVKPDQNATEKNEVSTASLDETTTPTNTIAVTSNIAENDERSELNAIKNEQTKTSNEIQTPNRDNERYILSKTLYIVQSDENQVDNMILSKVSNAIQTVNSNEIF